ncbi:hypothetical protein VTO42DRAFT_6675 [Malbranchea cinnamomea]
MASTTTTVVDGTGNEAGNDGDHGDGSGSGEQEPLNDEGKRGGADSAHRHLAQVRVVLDLPWKVDTAKRDSFKVQTVPDRSVEVEQTAGLELGETEATKGLKRAETCSW